MGLYGPMWLFTVIGRKTDVLQRGALLLLGSSRLPGAEVGIR